MIPKSVRPERMKENAGLFNFKLLPGGVGMSLVVLGSDDSQHGTLHRNGLQQAHCEAKKFFRNLCRSSTEDGSRDEGHR